MRESSTSKDTKPKKREKGSQAEQTTGTPPGHRGPGSFHATPWQEWGLWPVVSWACGCLVSMGVEVSLHIFCFLS